MAAIRNSHALSRNTPCMRAWAVAAGNCPSPNNQVCSGSASLYDSRVQDGRSLFHLNGRLHRGLIRRLAYLTSVRKEGFQAVCPGQQWTCGRPFHLGTALQSQASAVAAEPFMVGGADLGSNKANRLAEGITVLSITTTAAAKRSILGDLVSVYGKGCKSIVFTQTQRDADEVAAHLNQLMGCEALPAESHHAQREKALTSFRDGRISVLVTTDAAARDVDFADADLVVQYEVANDVEAFLNRSGQTGQAGKRGTVILMCTQMQKAAFDLLERELGCKFENIEPPAAEDVIKCAADQAVFKIQNVAPQLKDIFLPVAEKLLLEQGPEVLAAALAQMCGCNQIPTSRSLLSHEQGWMTLKITFPGQSDVTMDTVTRYLGQVYPVAALNVRRISLLADSEVRGAVFDLPERIANDLLSRRLDSIEAIKKLPSIKENTSANSFGSMFSSGTGGFNSGGFSGGGASGQNMSRPADSSWSSRSQAGYGASTAFSRPPTYGNNDFASRQPSNYGSSPSASFGSSNSSTGFGSSRPSSFGSPASPAFGSPTGYGSSNWSSKPSTSYGGSSSVSAAPSTAGFGSSNWSSGSGSTASTAFTSNNSSYGFGSTPSGFGSGVPTGSGSTGLASNNSSSGPGSSDWLNRLTGYNSSPSTSGSTSGSGSVSSIFPSKCLECGQPGHRAIDCPNLKLDSRE